MNIIPEVHISTNDKKFTWDHAWIKLMGSRRISESGWVCSIFLRTSEQSSFHFYFNLMWFCEKYYTKCPIVHSLKCWWSRFNLDQFQELITFILGPTSLLVKFSSSCLLSNPAKKIGNKPITKTSRAEEKSGNRNLIYETEIILTIRFLFWLSTWQMQFRNK